MKAVAKLNEKVGFDYIDMPMPKPGSDDVLIKIHATAICGSDVHYYNWNQWAKDMKAKYNIKFPLVAGHECCGEIIEVGKNVSKNRIGERVAIETHIPCGECYQCKTGNAHNCMNGGIYGSNCNGCFSAYATAPACVAFKIPDDMSYEEGTLLEPAGVAMRALERAAVEPGDIVVVNGCGPIGLFCIQQLLVCGAAKVLAVDLDEYRLALAKKFGAIPINAKNENVVDVVLSHTKIRGGADAVIEFTAAAPVYRTIFDMIRLEGRLVTVGHVSEVNGVNIAKNINMKGISIRGVYGRGIWQTWYRLIPLIQNKRINVLDVATHRFPFSQYQEAFEQLKKGAGKVLLIPDEE